MSERYLDIPAALSVLAEMGVVITTRQFRRALENKRIPYFLDPLSHKVRVMESRLRAVYENAAVIVDSAPPFATNPSSPQDLPQAAPQAAPQKGTGKVGNRKGIKGRSSGGQTFRQRMGLASKLGVSR